MLAGFLFLATLVGALQISDRVLKARRRREAAGHVGPDAGPYRSARAAAPEVAEEDPARFLRQQRRRRSPLAALGLTWLVGTGLMWLYFVLSVCVTGRR